MLTTTVTSELSLRARGCSRPVRGELWLSSTADYGVHGLPAPVWTGGMIPRDGVSLCAARGVPAHGLDCFFPQVSQAVRAWMEQSIEFSHALVYTIGGEWVDRDVAVQEVAVRSLTRGQLRDEILALLKKRPGLDAFEIAGELEVPALDVLAVADELVAEGMIEVRGEAE